MTRIKELEDRVERIGRDGYVPAWLTAVASQEEVAEYTAILKSYQGFDFAERVSKFTRRMRVKYPGMSVGLAERLEAAAEKLMQDGELAKRQGLI